MFGEPLYRSREEKAAHLLYFVVKDHPFTDGNKRIGSLIQPVSIRPTEPSSNPFRPITTSRVLRSSPSRQSRS